MRSARARSDPHVKRATQLDDDHGPAEGLRDVFPIRKSEQLHGAGMAALLHLRDSRAAQVRVLAFCLRRRSSARASASMSPRGLHRQYFQALGGPLARRLRDRERLFNQLARASPTRGLWPKPQPKSARPFLNDQVSWGDISNRRSI